MEYIDDMRGGDSTESLKRGEWDGVGFWLREGMRKGAQNKGTGERERECNHARGEGWARGDLL
jgi:hypothetical protein